MAALALFALLVRALRWAQTAVMMNDGPEFLRLAADFAEGRWRAALDHNFHPLYPLAVAVAHAALPDWELAAVSVSVLGGSLAVAALFALVREGFDRRSAAIAALLLAVSPTAIELSDVQSDALYLGLFVASAALLLRAHLRESGRSAFAAGLVTGLAYLTRPEGVGTAVAGLTLAGFELASRHLSVSRALRLAAPLCAGALLVMSPYVAYRSLAAGELVLTGKKSVSRLLGVSALRQRIAPGSAAEPARAPLDPLLAEHPELTPPPRGVHPFRDAPVPTGGERYSTAAARLLRQTLRALRPEGALLVLLGLLAARGRPGRRGRFFAAYMAIYAIVLFGLSVTSDYLSRRHVLPPLTLLLGYGALGVGVVAAGLERVPGLTVRPALRIALPLALVAVLGLGKALRPARADSLPERQAAEWIRAQGALAPDEAVAAVKQRVGYYAHARFVDLRRAPHPDLLLPYLRREHVRFVVVDQGERDELLRLVRAEPDALALRQREARGRHEAFVFELQR